MKTFKKVLARLVLEQVSQYKAYKGLIKNNSSYLYSTGWIESLKAGKPINKDGKPIPWMNFPVIKLLEEKLTSDLNLFEYGSGYSTYYFADKVKSVVSVESNEDWYHLIRSHLPNNVTLIFKETDINGEYCRTINYTKDHYDVVVVDGRDRVNCVKHGISALSAAGVILLDDSQRERYREAINFAEEKGFKALVLEGLKATGTRVHRTTILYREGNCFEI